ncbi:MAG: hypothetical protein CFE49_07460 [Pseudomonas sp. PGPPP3]|jgi:hypothetical protein|nr:MAG: hypothetical protein CFE49_07460 [Pseudomonas sp. PGPPP3]
MDDKSEEGGSGTRSVAASPQHRPELYVVVTPGVTHDRRSSKILPWGAANLVAHGPFSPLPRQVQPAKSTKVTQLRAHLAAVPLDTL